MAWVEMSILTLAVEASVKVTTEVSENAARHFE